MRNLIYLPLLLSAAWNYPLKAQWANPLNPTGLPRHMLKPAEVATGAGLDPQAIVSARFVAPRDVARNLRYHGHASHFRQLDVWVQVRRKFRPADVKERNA